MNFENKILIIGGPTATGKTEISYLVAKKLNGEIISADSRQFYKEINIGTDKPPVWMREEIPHHFVDFLSIKDEFDVFEYIKISYKKVKEILEKKKIPIIVGGSGFYIRYLIKGLFVLPEELKEKQKEIRNLLEKEKTEILYERLKEIDPEIIKKIHPNDRFRIRRALEIFYLTKKTISYWQKKKSEISLENIGKIFYFILFRERGILYERIKKRIEEMFENGWIKEVKKLKEEGFENEIKKKAPIGYKEIIDFLDGNYDFEKLKEVIFKRTKEYARKQITWFKRENGIFIYLKDEENKLVANKIIEIFKERCENG